MAMLKLTRVTAGTEQLTVKRQRFAIGFNKQHTDQRQGGSIKYVHVKVKLSLQLN
jgi:hypothetical protein